MNKSDRKAFQGLLDKDTRPRSQKTDDLSEDLARQFDDGTPLPSAKSTTGTGGTSSTGGTPGTGTSLPVAPVRDYMKVANSLHREAAPAGVFKGKGKLIYDYLYSRTRGAIIPTRTVQATWGEIMKAASIGSDKTLREHLKALRSAGLLTWEWAEGSQGGSVYTVYLPEETPGTSGTPGTASTSGTSGQVLPAVPPVESTPGTGSLNFSFQRTSDESKTFSKTKTEKPDDDDWLPGLRAAVKGQNLPKVAALLVSLVKLLDSRTDVISYDGLLAHHLGRKLQPRANTARRRPSEEPFVPPTPVEFSDEELEELRQIVAAQKAELPKP